MHTSAKLNPLNTQGSRGIQDGEGEQGVPGQVLNY